MFFLVRMIALAILGPWALDQLERNFTFGVVLSAISVVLTAWIVVDAISVINSFGSWMRS
jgi:hypothetical protein